MHPNPAFRKTPDEANLAFAREHGFGTLAVSGPTGPLLSHIPFDLDAAGAEARFHLQRSNAIARALTEPAPARLAVLGAGSYVSPDWYALGHVQVPTWNYVAVHLVGAIEALPPETLRPHLRALSDRFEERLAPAKPPWRIDKMPEEAMARMERMILPYRLRIDAVEGTWKLNQNKPAEARRRAADEMSAAFGARAGALPDLMRKADDA